MKKKNWCRILYGVLISMIFPLSFALTLADISNYLLDEKLTEKTPDEMIKSEGLLGVLEKTVATDEEIIFSTQKKPNTTEVTFMYLDEKWQFNDASFSYYSSKIENCQKQMAAFKKHLTKRLGDPNKSQVRESVVWQLVDRDWGIWLTVDNTINPFTEQTGCTSKIVVIYSSLEGQNGEEDF